MQCNKLLTIESAENQLRPCSVTTSPPSVIQSVVFSSSWPAHPVTFVTSGAKTTPNIWWMSNNDSF